MKLAEADDEERQVELEVEIIQHLWEQGTTTIAKLAEEWQLSRSCLRAGIDKLAQRRWVYQLWPSPQGQDLSVYSLTSGAIQKLRQLSEGHARYRLKRLWDALQREQRGLPSPIVKL
ncbi:MAG TPA: hypothetical protein ENI60_02610 [Candidatus Fraserbacteria bacterium]|nr:hypothetical protein [Candidatus Fraserbacteria bacterium]